MVCLPLAMTRSHYYSHGRNQQYNIIMFTVNGIEESERSIAAREDFEFRAMEGGHMQKRCAE